MLPPLLCPAGGLHWLRPLRMFMGEIKAVMGTTGKALPHMRGPSMAQSVLIFESGRSAIFESILAPGAISHQPFFTIQGTKGEIVLDGFAGGGRVYTEDAEAEGGMRCTPLKQAGWASGYAGELADFARCILEGRQPKAAAEEALADLKVMLTL
jgi:predicted dehydrogenase